MPRTPLRPAPLACDTCRSRHLRCDGAKPCNRCSKDSNAGCSYTPSRRGLTKRTTKGTQALPITTPISPRSAVDDGVNLALATTSEPCIGDASTSVVLRQITGQASAEGLHTWPSVSGGVHSHGALLSACEPEAPNTGASHHGMPTPHSISLEAPPQRAQDSPLVDLYYTNFHPSHPFLVPRACYDSQAYPLALHMLVCWAGQRYHKTNGAFDLSTLVEQDIRPRTGIESVSSIQTLLLAAILLHSNCHAKEAKRCIDTAMQMSTNLGIMHSTFAANAATSEGVESMRRTWWELYIADVYLSSLHRRQCYYSGRSSSAHPCLPSHSDQGVRPTDLWLRDFESRIFLNGFDEQVYSPYCYRIEVIRIMARLQAPGKGEVLEAGEVQAIDNALVGWTHNLPSHMRNVIDALGNVNSQLLQAHYLAACASIFLHFPRSDLPATVPATADITGAQQYVALVPTSSVHRHKAIAASQDLCNLAAIPLPTESQSPLFACALILACIVQLAAASMLVHRRDPSCLQQYRDRVIMLLGLLKSMAMYWDVAAKAVERLRPIAAVIFMADDSSVMEQLSLLEDFDNVAWMDLFESEALLS